MRIIFLTFLVVLISRLAVAQLTFSESNAEHDSLEILTRLQVNQDPRLNDLLIRHIQKNKSIRGMEGYRVEIFFGSDVDARKKAETKKVEFLSRYPDIAAYVKYEAPNFRLRVGDFRTKNEALKLYKKVKTDFPVAFIVSDEINFPLLKPMHYE